MIKSSNQPEWVVAQHKTMIRWINSKLDTQISDLTTDLKDGLILIKLINQIIQESDEESYILTPMYSKPTFMLQKIENLNDFFKFCKLVLQINICNISADNIIEGNLKLILGLIWLIFIYSTSKSLTSKNESNSLIQIKSILLNWCNDIIHKKALPSINNFNKDWSLEINRPDLIFASILDYYLPSSINYQELLDGKKLQNLTNILSIAKKIEIPQLADLEDFDCFVPDEKCIIFYVLEWFKFFELNKDKDIRVNEDDIQPQSISISESEITSKTPTSLTTFMETIITTLKLKHKYETKSLRLINQLNSNIVKFSSHLDFLIDNILTDNVNIFLNNFQKSYENDSLVPLSTDNFNNIEKNFGSLICIMKDFENFKNELKPGYINDDLPELKKTLNSIITNLELIGLTNYQPPKSLVFDSLTDKLNKQNELEEKLTSKLLQAINDLNTKSMMGDDFNTYLVIMGQNLQNLKQTSRDLNNQDLIIDYINKFDYLISITHELDYFKRFFNLKQSPLELKSLALSFDNKLHDCSPIKFEFDKSPFRNFKDQVNQIENPKKLSFIDVQKFSNMVFDNNYAIMNTFIQLIPHKTLINRSDSDFSIHYPSDESDDSNSLFDGLQKKLNGQLMGNCNKVYNLLEFVDKLENGFTI